MATATVNGTTLHYEDRGKGHPVALLHGFPLDSSVWSAQIEALSARYRVIAPDLRGFGKSPDGGSFSIASLAEDVHALLKQLEALPCVLGGLSMGGYVALAFAREFPADLRGLMLIDTKCEADTAEARDGRDQMIELVRRQGNSGVAERMMPKMLAESHLQTRPDLVKRLRKIMEACPATTIEQALTAMRERPDYRDMLASIPVPALGIVGQFDAITPPDGVKTMCGQIPRSQVVVIRGAGHMSPIEQPEQVTQAIERFLAALKG